MTMSVSNIIPNAAWHVMLSTIQCTLDTTAAQHSSTPTAIMDVWARLHDGHPAPCLDKARIDIEYLEGAAVIDRTSPRTPFHLIMDTRSVLSSLGIAAESGQPGPFRWAKMNALSKNSNLDPDAYAAEFSLEGEQSTPKSIGITPEQLDAWRQACAKSISAFCLETFGEQALRKYRYKPLLAQLEAAMPKGAPVPLRADIWHDIEPPAGTLRLTFKEQYARAVGEGAEQPWGPGFAPEFDVPFTQAIQAIFERYAPSSTGMALAQSRGMLLNITPMHSTDGKDVAMLSISEPTTARGRVVYAPAAALEQLFGLASEKLKERIVTRREQQAVLAPRDEVADTPVAEREDWETQAADLHLDGSIVRLPKRNLPDFDAIKQLAQAAGGTYKGGKTMGFAFDSPIDAQTAYQAILERRNIQQETQFFETAADDAQTLIDDLKLNGPARVLEPSGGRGAIAIPLLAAGHLVCAYENHEPNFQALQQAAQSDGAASARLSVQMRDFLAVSPDEQELYDGVAMNPPFANGAAAQHILHAVSFLAPHARLAAIAPQSLAFERRYQKLRDLLEFIDSPAMEMPKHSFRHAGTAAQTVKLVIDMPTLLDRIRETGINPQDLGIDVSRQLALTERGVQAPVMRAA